MRHENYNNGESSPFMTENTDAGESMDPEAASSRSTLHTLML
jgi:hypothetical protein